MVSAGIPKEQLRREADYQAAFDSAMSLKNSQQCELAVSKFQEAERLTEGLTDTRYVSLQKTLGAEADCLLTLKRYSEAEQALQHRTEALRAWTDEYDGAYAHNFMELALVRSLQNDWAGAEEYCLRAMKAYDKVIDHFSGPGNVPEIVTDERRAKAVDMYWFGVIYYKEGKTDESLSVLEQAFTTASELHAKSSDLSNIATAGQNIALNTGHPIEAKKWAARLGNLPTTEDGKPR